MSMRSPTVQDSDLSARAKIREAALRLFGTSGFGVSLRAIAQAAGVSPGLVIHHFGSKDGLRAAVDESVLAVFLERFDSLPKDLPADLLSRAMATVFSDVLGPSPDIRQYLRRCLLDETPAGTTIFDEMVAATQRGLEMLGRAGGIRADSDPEWRPFQVLAVVLGPLLLEPVMQRHLGEPAYAPDVVRRRTAANLDVLSRGLFTPAAEGHEAPTP
ncbi:MAG: TetR/AcrR family transcriptional regulator [Candidatus Dormibacteria bacterium]|jgi:AcrR family transcriptional regulator